MRLLASMRVLFGFLQSTDCATCIVSKGWDAARVLCRRGRAVNRFEIPGMIFASLLVVGAIAVIGKGF